MAKTNAVQLSDDDIAFLLMLLRNSPQPLSMQRLIESLRQQGSQSQST